MKNCASNCWEAAIKIAVDLESLGKFIPPLYRDEKARNAQLFKKYKDECARPNQPIDYMKCPYDISSFFASGEEAYPADSGSSICSGLALPAI